MSTRIRQNFDIINDNQIQMGNGIKVDDLSLYNPFNKQQDKKQIIAEANRSGAATAKSKNHTRLLSDTNVLADYIESPDISPSLANGK